MNITVHQIFFLLTDEQVAEFERKAQDGDTSVIDLLRFHYSYEDKSKEHGMIDFDRYVFWSSYLADRGDIDVMENLIGAYTRLPSEIRILTSECARLKNYASIVLSKISETEKEAFKNYYGDFLTRLESMC